MPRWRKITWIVFGIAAVVTVRLALAAGGGTQNDPQETYTNAGRGAPAEGVIASVTVQLVSHRLNSVSGKYKLIPVLVRTDGRPTPLTLSLSRDRLVVLSGDQRVPASFQLSALDRALWDSLGPDLKTWLTYPEQVSAGSARMVYAFAPVADLKEPLKGFEYTIASLPAPLQLQPEPKKKAAALSRDLAG